MKRAPSSLLFDTNIHIMTTSSGVYPLSGTTRSCEFENTPEALVSAKFVFGTKIALQMHGEDTYKSQLSLLQQAAVAGYFAWSGDVTHGLGAEVLIEFNIEESIKLNFTESSRSCGLGYALAASLTMAKYYGWMEHELPITPIFCTGRVSENGDVDKIDEVERKIHNILEYLNPSTHLNLPTQFTLILPKANNGDINPQQIKQLAQHDIKFEIYYVQNVSEALEIMLGGAFKVNSDKFEPPGLSSINYDQRSLFLGRENIVLELTHKAKNNALTGRVSTIIGNSGSGKSSLAMAGIVPKLKTDADLNLLSYIDVRPSEIGSVEKMKIKLLKALLGANYNITQTAEELAKIDTSSLLKILGKCDSPKVIWLIDQWEELFYLDSVSIQEQAAFKEWLIRLCESKHAIVITTLRAGFDEEENVILKADNTLRLHLPTINDIREIIIAHLRAFNIQFPIDKTIEDKQERLIEQEKRKAEFIARLSDDASDAPLSTLSFLLTKLYKLDDQRRNDTSDGLPLPERTYSLTDYQEVGGVEGVIASQTKEALSNAYPSGKGQQPSELAQKHQELLNPFFCSLLAHNSDKKFSPLRHKPVSKNFLNDESAQPLGLKNILIRSFENVGLLRECGGTDNLQLKLAHDSLLELSAEPDNEASRNSARWPALAHWHYEYQDYLQWFYHVEHSFNCWQRLFEQGKTKKYLIVDKENLKIAEELKDDGKIHSAALKNYIIESVKLSRKKAIKYMSGLSIIVIFSITLSLVAWWQSHEAIKSKNETESALVVANHHISSTLYERAKIEFSRGNHEDAKFLLAYSEPLKDKKKPRINFFSHYDFKSSNLLVRKQFFSQNIYSDSVLFGLCESYGNEIANGGSFISEVNTLANESPLFKRLLKSNTTSLSSERKLIAFGLESKVEIWDLVSLEKRSLNLLFKPINIVFSGSGDYLAITNSNRELIVWDLKSNSTYFTRNEHSINKVGFYNNVSSATFSPNDQKLVYGSFDGSLKIWDFKSSKPRLLTMEKYSITSVEFFPDGKKVAYGDWNGNIFILRQEQGISNKISNQGNIVLNLSISPNGEKIASSSPSNVFLWSAKGDRLNKFYQGFSSGRHVKFLKSNELIVACSPDSISLYDAKGLPYDHFTSDGEETPEIDLNSNHSRAIISDNHSLLLWDFKTKQRLKVFNHNENIVRVRLLNDDETVVFLDRKSKLNSFNLLSGEFNRLGLALNNQRKYFEISSDDELLVTFESEKLQLWNLIQQTKSNFSISGYHISKAIFSAHSASIFIVATKKGTNSTSILKFDYIRGIFTTLREKIAGYVIGIDDGGNSNEVVVLTSSGGLIIMNLGGNADTKLSIPSAHRNKSDYFSVSIPRKLNKISSNFFSIVNSANEIVEWNPSLNNVTFYRFAWQLNREQVIKVRYHNEQRAIITKGLEGVIKIFQFTAGEFTVDDWVLIQESLQLELGFKLIDGVMKREYNFDLMQGINAPIGTIKWKKHHAQYWQSAAEQGDATAMLELGIIAQRDKNWNLANSWYEKAKVAGHDEADYRLRHNKLIREQYEKDGML